MSALSRKARAQRIQQKQTRYYWLCNQYKSIYRMSFHIWHFHVIGPSQEASCLMLFYWEKRDPTQHYEIARHNKASASKHWQSVRGFKAEQYNLICHPPNQMIVKFPVLTALIAQASLRNPSSLSRYEHDLIPCPTSEDGKEWIDKHEEHLQLVG